jgi:predicted membrane protein (TIGR00267 family)
MMRFELNLEEPDPRQAPISAATIGISYIVGGLVPLLPYMLVADLKGALYISVAMTLVALGLFGTIKGRLTGLSAWRSGVQMAAIGGLAAAVAFGLARLVSDWG